MILRVLRARVIEGAEGRLAQFVRDESVAHALRVPGLQSLQPAVRETRAGLELVIVSSWSGFDEIAAAGTIDAPLAMPGAEPFLAEAHAEHYELVIGQARTMPLRQAKLRLTRIPIRQNMEARYYDTVRAWSDRLLDQNGMVAFTLGRRVVGRQDDIIAVQVFQDADALREVAGAEIDRPMGGDELAPFWAADPAIEHFDALTAVEARPDAPAILLADDGRHYVHATPEAARISGRSLARLLTMRVEDLTRRSERELVPGFFERFVAEGRMSGPYTLERPDGSEVGLQFAAKANSPWPGSHASLLVPDDGRGEDRPAAQDAQGDRRDPNSSDDADDRLDIDQALVEAGLVARYARTPTEVS